MVKEMKWFIYCDVVRGTFGKNIFIWVYFWILTVTLRIWYIVEHAWSFLSICRDWLRSLGSLLSLVLIPRVDKLFQVQGWKVVRDLMSSNNVSHGAFYLLAESCVLYNGKSHFVLFIVAQCKSKGIVSCFIYMSSLLS